MISIAGSSILRMSALSTGAPARALVVAQQQQQRQLSMSCSQSIHKLNNILEEYRATNYTQELPKRFQKDIVKVATQVSSRNLSSCSPNNINGVISAEGIEHVLNNIGAGHRMSRSEIEFILSEVGVCPLESASSEGSASCVISADQMLNLISMKKF